MKVRRPGSIRPAECPIESGKVSEAVQQSKANLRASMRRRLAALSPADVADASEAACRLLAGSDAFARAEVVLLYAAMPTEPDTGPLARRCLASGKRLCLPRADWETSQIDPFEVADWEHGLLQGRHGIREPGINAPLVPLGEIDLIVVPGLAFDEAGRRLGRGGGFYDRFLERTAGRAFAFGLAFDEQVVSEVPAETHDASVDAVATDRRLIMTHGG